MIMTGKINYQITEYCHRFLRDYIAEGDCCIDATCGNGNDTEFLCRMVGEKGTVYAFDIQEQAVKNTQSRLEKKGFDSRAVIICGSHENMDKYVKTEVSAIMFNFGYLPGGDHRLATKAASSLRAVEKSLRLLKDGGVMSLCIYSGGDTGYEEKEALLQYLKQLDPAAWLVITCCYFNRKNDPPLPVFVIRLK